MPASSSSPELSSHQMAIRSHPGVQKMPASGISPELSAHQMAPAGAITHSRAHLCPRAFPFVLLLRRSTLALRLGDSGSWRPSELYVVISTSLRTQVRPAIEFVSGKEGLRPRFAVFVSGFAVASIPGVRLLGHPEVRKGPWPLRRPRRDGNGGRFVRSPCLLSWCGLRLLYAVHQMLSLLGPCTAMVH